MSTESLDLSFDLSQNYRSYLITNSPNLDSDYIIGTPGTKTLSYKISSVTADGETDLSEELIVSNCPAILSSLNFVRIHWHQTEKTLRYNIYKKSDGAFYLLGSTTHFHFDDIGQSLSSISHQGYNSTGYDSSFVNLGTNMLRYTGSNIEDNYIGPLNEKFFHNAIAFSNNRYGYIFDVIRLTRDIDVIFQNNVSNTQNIMFNYYDRRNHTFTQGGIAWFDFMASSNMYIADVNVLYEKSYQGYVSVSGSTVTGYGTLFDSLRFSVGSRIGFGSTNYENITEWYEVASVNSDTSITLQETVSKTYPNFCPYIIDEIQFIMSVFWNQGTYDRGGLFIAKGLTLTNMITNTKVLMATNQDRQRALYRLTTPGTNLITYLAVGHGLRPKFSNTEQLIYVLSEYSNNYKIHVFNIRAPLTVVSGASTSAYRFATKTYDIPNGGGGIRYFCLPTGLSKNKPCLLANYGSSVFVIDLDDIKQDADLFWKEHCYARYIGGNYYDTGNNIQNNTRYVPNLDMILFSNRYASLVKFDTNAPQYDIQFGSFTGEYTDYRNTQGKTVPYYSAGSNFFPIDGLWYYNAEYKLSIIVGEADFLFAEKTKSRIITQAINTAHISKFKKVLVSHPEYLGDINLGISPEFFKLYYRTDGINDDTGSWTYIDDTFDISGVKPKDQIQFMFEFRILGVYCTPSRIYGLSITYDVDDELPIEFEWNLNDCDNTNAILGFEQTSLVTNFNQFNISFYQSSNDVKVFNASSAENINGNFQYFNGSTWINGVGPNAVGTRRRFVSLHKFPSEDIYAKIILV
jgi:hypothetical protein